MSKKISPRWRRDCCPECVYERVKVPATINAALDAFLYQKDPNNSGKYILDPKSKTRLLYPETAKHILRTYPFYRAPAERFLHSISYDSPVGQSAVLAEMAKAIRKDIKGENGAFDMEMLVSNIVALYLTTDGFSKTSPEPDLLKQAGYKRIDFDEDLINQAGDILSSVQDRVRAWEKIRRTGDVNEAQVPSQDTPSEPPPPEPFASRVSSEQAGKNDSVLMFKGSHLSEVLRIRGDGPILG